jgi:hypothetical protein
MFAGLSMICLIPFLITAEHNHADTSGVRVDDNHIAISLHGDIAREYVRLLRSKQVSDAFLRDGCVTIEGMADKLGDGTVQIHHTAFVRIVGEPVRLLRLRSMIDASLVKHGETVAGIKAGYRVDLSDLRSSELRSLLLVGDFPDSQSYR